MFADFSVEFLGKESSEAALLSFLSLKEGQITIPEPAKKYSPGLLGDSERAFELGKGGSAVRLLKGAALVEEPGVDLTRLMFWSPALRRPTMAVRWGVGWQAFGGERFAVAGSTPAERAEQARRQGTRGDEIEGPVTALSSSASLKDQLRVFQIHTFGQGKPILTELSDRSDHGFFGTALKKPAGKEEERPRLEGIALSGINMLGEGEPQKIQEEALKSGCDLLLFVEARYRESGKPAGAADEKEQSQTMTIKVIQVVSGEELWASKPITSGHIARIKKNPDAGPDPLTELLKEFAVFLDEKLPLANLPELSAEQVQRRVVSLISVKDPNPLNVLTEIKLYESLKLLTSEELSKVYQRYLGESEGAQLATGTPEQRMRAVRPFLP
jgi:hypothetical protein